jgi:hypothetical protein
MADIPPVTFTPRQARIYEQLARLGAAPAAYFADVCRLFQGLAPLEAGGHVAGHLLRELKGSVKDVLLPEERKNQKDGDRLAIEEIAKAWGLSNEHEIVQLWPKLKLHRLAHRSVLGSPHQLDDVRQAWDEFQIVLSVLLDALDSAYTVIYERIDRLVAKSDPTDDDLIELLTKTPSNPHTLGYFFGKVRGRQWFELLRGSRVFDDPPTGGYWPQIHYLRRVVADYPDDIAPIFERIAGTPNVLTIMQVLDGLPSVTPTTAGRILRTCATSLMALRGQDMYLAREVAKRAVDISRDDPDAALDVFATLLTLGPEKDEPQGGYLGSRELASPLDYHTYADVGAKPLHELIAIVPRRGFEQLLDILHVALLSIYSASKPDDYSTGWMPAIEPHEQNDYHYEPLPRLAEAVRDAAEALCNADQTALRDVIGALDRRGWQVLQRLALYLLDRFGDPNDVFVQARVLDADSFFERDLRHEYGALLKNVFPALDDEQKRMLLDWMKGGPRAIPEHISDDDAKLLRESWTWLRLGWIREHLNTEDAALLAALENTHGVPDETAEFSFYMSGPFVGPTSPKNEDDLRAMPISEIVRYLLRWQPAGERPFDHFAPTREGLARQLQPVVKARAAEFAAAAESFIGLDPTYVRAIIAGIDDGVKEHAIINWPATLALCAWAVEQTRDISGRDPQGFDDDPGWSWTWAAIARLLRAGFSAKNGARLPKALRQSVWRVLAPITRDPDPDVEREKDDRDPYSVAINSTRGVAMESVMRFVLWARDGAPGTDFADMPEVEDVLNRHLDPGIDPSKAIRAVYGEFLFVLHRMASTWFTSHVDALFPDDRAELAVAVLEAYLAWGRWMSPEFNAILVPQFARVIESLHGDEGDAEPKFTHNLAHRLVTMYLYGDADLSSGSLLDRFLVRASEKTRAFAVSLLPSVVGDSKEEEHSMMRQRCIAFWEWRLAHVSDGELRGFGRWMESSDFDDGWKLAQLEVVLERVGSVEMDYQIAGRLGRLASGHPAATIRCARLLVGTSLSAMELNALMYRHDLHRIIRAGIESNDMTLQRDATAFANELVARGFSEFRGVLDPDYRLPPAGDDD